MTERNLFSSRKHGRPGGMSAPRVLVSSLLDRRTMSGGRKGPEGRRNRAEMSGAEWSLLKREQQEKETWENEWMMEIGMAYLERPRLLVRSGADIPGLGVRGGTTRWSWSCQSWKAESLGRGGGGRGAQVTPSRHAV